MTKTAFYKIQYGILRIEYTEKHIIRLDCVEREDFGHEPSALTHLAWKQMEEYFAGKRKNFDFPFRLIGTDFQKKVWQALCRIPYGQTRTYGEIAKEIGNPKASRAVGMACNRNPIWIAVPCHRVVGAGGKLTGYAGGIAMKEALLSLEQGVS